MKVMLTEHFSQDEFIVSAQAMEKGIDNIPTDDVLRKLRFTAAGLERVRAMLGFEIRVHSGYRCPALNKAVGGSLNSQHMRGEAVDFTCPHFGPPEAICLFLNQWMATLGIDQLIYEGLWVHVSFALNPRNEALTFIDGKYKPGIV
jgi:zinc D-Ala-D-Ala carboxypeptidase